MIGSSASSVNCHSEDLSTSGDHLCRVKSSYTIAVSEPSTLRRCSCPLSIGTLYTMLVDCSETVTELC